MKRCMKYVVGVLVFTCFVIAIAYIIAKISYINKVKSYLDNKYPGVEFSVVDINYSILSESMLARVEEEHRSLIFSVSNLNSNLSDDYEEVLVEANIIDEIGIIIQTNDLQGDVGRVEVSYLALDENFMDSRYELDIDFTEKVTNQVEFAELAYKLITACQSSNYGNLKFVRIYQEIDNCSRSLCVYAKDYIDATQELRVEQVKEILSK